MYTHTCSDNAEYIIYSTRHKTIVLYIHTCTYLPKPHALYTPRNVPIPLKTIVQSELMRIKSMGMISKVKNTSKNL